MTPAADSSGAGRGRPAEQSDGARPDAASQRALKPRFTFDVHMTLTAAFVTLSGELDVVCADVFRRKFTDLTDEEPERVIMDLRGLTFLDSTGLALLLRVNEMSRDLGFGLSMVSAEDNPASRIFRMTGTNDILPLVAEPPDD